MKIEQMLWLAAIQKERQASTLEEGTSYVERMNTLSVLTRVVNNYYDLESQMQEAIERVATDNLSL